MSALCSSDSLLFARYQQMFMSSVNKNINNNNSSSYNQKIWNPAFTESEHERQAKELSLHERQAKELILHNRHKLDLLAHAAVVGRLRPPPPPKLFPTHQVSICCKQIYGDCIVRVHKSEQSCDHVARRWARSTKWNSIMFNYKPNLEAQWLLIACNIFCNELICKVLKSKISLYI